MKYTIKLLALALAATVRCSASDPVLVQSQPAATAAENDSSLRAAKRYEEMLSRMQASIEDIAQMYGNPTFLQIFTNDVARASELKQRLHVEKNEQLIEKELRDLARRRDNLLDDIALKEREAAGLTKKLATQRAALDAVAGAIEQARAAVEDTSK